MGEITNFKGEAQSSAPLSAEALLIQRVAERVRRARERKGIPRRVLSERSGVSPRYLAQLEAGEGNISIALLHRVAEALDHRMEWLVSEEDPWESEAIRVAEMFKSAPGPVRAQVLDLLSPLPVAELKANRICLIGLRGAGKSTLGARVGAKLGMPFVELNREIEEIAGMPVTEVMALYGQEGYRKLESQAINRIIATHQSLILAVAGGIVAEPETYATLLSRFHTIWVQASPSEHMNRVRAQGDTRPLAGNPEAMEQLKSILSSREALYARAEARLDTTGRSPADSMEDLITLIANRGFNE